MLIYVNITDRQTYQKYSSEPHKIHINLLKKRVSCVEDTSFSTYLFLFISEFFSDFYQFNYFKK